MGFHVGKFLSPMDAMSFFHVGHSIHGSKSPEQRPVRRCYGEAGPQEQGKPRCVRFTPMSNYSDLRRVFTPNGGLVREIPETFREIVWLVKYYEPFGQNF